jgi:hypothetical protein
MSISSDNYGCGNWECTKERCDLKKTIESLEELLAQYKIESKCYWELRKKILEWSQEQ